jgi:hypothetical protein
LLVFAGFPHPYKHEEGHKSSEILCGQYYCHWFDVGAGTHLELSFSSNSDVSLWVMDSKNYGDFITGGDYTTLYQEGPTSELSFAFETPKPDEYYFLIFNPGEDTVTASVTWAMTYGSFSPASYAGAGLTGVGVVLALLGVRLKPKSAESCVSNSD